MKECSKCKSNEYSNKALVMLINECAHPLCKNCVENLYARNAAPCHVCGRILRKNTFWEQVFDDPMVEKETNIRKRLRKIYNLKEDDFPTLRDYNDYLEQFEMTVYNLANDIEVEEMEREVNEFKTMNADLIERNRRRLDPDQQWIADQLKEEREHKRRLHEQQMAEAAAEAEKTTKIDTKAIMDEIRESKMPAEMILDRERKRQIEAELMEKEEAEKKKRRQKELAVSRKRAADQISFTVSSGSGRMGGVAGRERLFKYSPPVYNFNGPEMPPLDRLESLGYLQYMRAPRADVRAGGYMATIGAARALQEARMDLLAF